MVLYCMAVYVAVSCFYTAGNPQFPLTNGTWKEKIFQTFENKHDALI